MCVVSARHGMGMPKGPLFAPIPIQGPYFLDNHGRLTEVDRGTYAILTWEFRTLIALSGGLLCFGIVIRLLRGKN
jgi:hypothetical protein